MSPELIKLFYLVAGLLFAVAIKMLSHPRTAVRGNLVGSLGMLIAVVVTLLDQRILSYEVIVAGIIVGSFIGIYLAFKPPMTDVPQVVAIFNGFGGAASALAVGAALEELLSVGLVEDITLQFSLAALFSCLVGGISFTGSGIAFLKLQGLMRGSPILLPGRHVINALLLVACLYFSYDMILNPSTSTSFWIVFALSSLLGVLLVIPIGGADMPVVISLLNSYSGIAAAADGWALNNSVLIIGGSLVGAAGFILTMLMSKAMNRSLPNIIFAAVGQEIAGSSEQSKYYEDKIKRASSDDVAMMLEGARKVIIVPGYGMAVAQAQFAISDLSRLLEKRGVEVSYAIHPVAGRMPGHMNVLLAEAKVEYDKLKDLDSINDEFSKADVALVIGANDTVNINARKNDPSLPISGMPILDVDKATSVVIIKRSLSAGFASVPNPLFIGDNVLMYFGDAKEQVLKLIKTIKEIA